MAALPESTVAYAIVDPPMPMHGVTFLSLVHEGLPDTPLAARLERGLVTIVSALKTLLETDEPMLAAPR